ncbi:universal stress protein [[Muricauda] lutisoli]|uniref:Universal stress protein n=1 Tax=[Muricauda] lutisoli TaxID=2816035 RepID=A0ABS3F039_9FLAO|nr:universal stress protein [[Muricauda] lutisoli]MBO0331867.1 universal stress protein [[Muricauda] lutisoli]
MKSIVCATDYSSGSVSALKMAHVLSDKLHAKLVVLHVFDLNIALLTPLSMTYQKVVNEEFGKHYERLEDFCKAHIGLDSSTKELELVVRENPIISEAITDVFIGFEAFLVVMGTKGTSALKNLIMGSNTAAMIKKGSCPLMTVPPDLSSFSLERIGYATDYDDGDIPVLSWLVKHIVAPLGSYLHVLHVHLRDVEAGEIQMNRFRALLKQKIPYNKIGFELMYAKHISDALMQYLERGEVDILIMLERGKKETFAHINMVKKIMRQTAIPLLSINESMVQ